MKTILECRKSALAAAVGGLVVAFGASAGDDKMQMMDTNKDGMISATEHSAGVKQMFAKMDADGDGKVTAAEMDASHKRMSGGTTGATSMSSADKIKTMDTNGDGMITADEHSSGASSKFSTMDTDGNGSLSSAELQAGHDKMMEQKPR